MLLRQLSTAAVLATVASHAAAFALPHTEPHSKRSDRLDRRDDDEQGTCIPTIYWGGLIGSPQKAPEGFEYRLDADNRVWGSCSEDVVDLEGCTLVGGCVDLHDCAGGCGDDRPKLQTITCSESGADYCSTALLTLSPSSGVPFTNLACGASTGAAADKPYLALATDLIVKTASSTSASSTVISSSSSAVSTSASHSSSNRISSTPRTSAGPDPSETPGSQTPGQDDDSDSDSGGSNNTGAIVGGVVGGLAVVCIAIVLVVWLMRRNKANKAGKEEPHELDAAKSSDAMIPPPSAAPSSTAEPFKVNMWEPARELPGTTYDPPAQYPVELSPDARYGRQELSADRL